MLYINYFEYAACLITAAILILFASRRSSITKSSRYFLVLCVTVMVCGITDIISSITISYPYEFPLWFNYFVSLLYLFSYISCGIVYFLYTDSMAKISSIETFVSRLGMVLVIYEILVVATSPWTHFIAYFDEARRYVHGSLYSVQFVISFLLLIGGILIVVKGRVRFSRFQQIILILFSVEVIATVAFQVFYPSILMGAFGSSIMLIFIYVSFENPAYYFFKETKCPNRDGYYRTMKEIMNKNHPFSMIAGKFEITNVVLNNTQRENLRRRIADRLSSEFKRNAFILENNNFAVLVEHPREDLSKEYEIESRIEDLFREPFILPERKVLVKITTVILPHTYKFKSVNEMENVIEMLVSSPNSEEGLDEHGRVEAVVNQNRRMAKVESIVERAIADKSFQVYYQPIYNVDTGRFESAEALVRLIDKEEGFISPEEFIPFAEQVGQIIPIGEIVFTKVCELLKRENFDALGIKYIEVNLSPIQCERAYVMDRLLEIMNDYRIKPGSINFEITETAEADIRADSPISNNILSMHEKGIGFSLDDFGSGFAAMDHLFQLPINLVKVDKSILWQAMEDENAMTVLRDTCRMVADLNKQILVEGVETQEMVDVLTEFGCKYMQGYFYSKPLPERDFVEFIKKNNN